MAIICSSTRTSLANRAATVLCLFSFIAMSLCGCQSRWGGLRKGDPSLEELIVTPEPWDAEARLAQESSRRVGSTNTPDRSGSRANPYAVKNSSERPDDRQSDGGPGGDELTEADFQEAYAAAPPHLRPLLKRQWQATQAASHLEFDDESPTPLDSPRSVPAKLAGQSGPGSSSDSLAEEQADQERSAASDEIANEATLSKSGSKTKSSSQDDESVRFSLKDTDEGGANAHLVDDSGADSDAASGQDGQKSQGRFVDLKPPAAARKTSRQVAHTEPIDTGMSAPVNLPGAARTEHDVQTAAAKTLPRDAAVTTASSEVRTGPTDDPAAIDEVVPAAAVGIAKEMSWHDHVREALRQLEKEHATAALNPAEQLNSQAISRMLHLSLGDLEPALKPIEGLQPAEQDFFRHEFQALHDAIDPRGNPVLARRWTLVMDSQRQAVSHLGAVSNLEIKNASFCSNVEGFGAVTKFPNSSFRPEQEVLLYCELENFVSLPVKDGFQTVLQGSYEIVDAGGHRVFEALLSEDSDICRHQRRDYFIAYRIYMPDNLEAGRYQLRLTIEDMKGRKFGQSSLDFQITK